MIAPPPYTREREGTQPPYDYPAYTSTIKRHPTRALIEAPHTLSEVTGPTFAGGWCGPNAADLTRIDGRSAEAQGQRIIVSGRVLDESG
ncbi:MAG: protocatechuate 3,4-dioxygenase, beta subunit, partial [Candidatus Eremiobacteraeota bacterium]|nr:protocatechuate 3,4-dioxygenase, beta subunit [Candidatus Eremiobacteraeota bacterium]